MLIKRTSYLTAGSFTHTFEAGRKWCRVFVTGGGAGGQGGHDNHAGYGGPAGGTAIKILDITGPNADIVVGAKGIGSTASSYTVSPGGTSSFVHGGVSVSATGGTTTEHGVSDMVKQGGIGSGGDLNLQGGGGARGQAKHVHGHRNAIGGQSYWGGMQGVGLYAKAGFGAPGAGGLGNDNTAADVTMCDGKDGCVVIEEFK
jgi:hypothetical protein